MQAVIVGWEIYRITKDVLSLGYIGLAEAIPALSLALYGGHIADKFDRKKSWLPVTWCCWLLSQLSSVLQAVRRGAFWQGLYPGALQRYFCYRYSQGLCFAGPVFINPAAYPQGNCCPMHLPGAVPYGRLAPLLAPLPEACYMPMVVLPVAMVVVVLLLSAAVFSISVSAQSRYSRRI